MKRALIAITCILLSTSLTHAEIPAPGGGGGPCESVTPGTGDADNETLSLDPSPNGRITITWVGVILPDGSQDDLAWGVDYIVHGQGTTNPKVEFLILPPDEDHSVHIHGTSNKPGPTTLTGTWENNN